MLNKTTIQGRLTNVPELKQVGETHIVGTATIAWNKTYNDKETKLFLRCKFWNAKATFLNNHFTKGSEIIVSGELVTESWDTEDGQRKSITVLNVDEVHFCGPKENNPKNNNTPPAQPNMNTNHQYANNPAPNNYQQQGFSVGDFTANYSDDDDDDFPY